MVTGTNVGTKDKRTAQFFNSIKTKGDRNMNRIAGFIKRYLNGLLGFSEFEEYYTYEEKIYQIICPSELRGFCGNIIDEDNNVSEVIDLIGDEMYSTADILDMLASPFYGLSDIFDIINKGYHISAIIELANIVPFIDKRYIMLKYSKGKTKKIKVCNYYGYIKYSKKMDSEDEWDEQYVDQKYKEYLDQVDKWVIDYASSKPVRTKLAVFYNLKYEDLPYFFEHLRPDLLNKEYITSRKQLQAYYKAGKTKTLGELATIIRPQRTGDEQSYYPNPTITTMFLTPGVGTDIDDKNGQIAIEDIRSVISADKRTNTQLHKGDYYMPHMEVFSWCPVLEEPPIPVYASEWSIVVRPNDQISAEYLFLYFETDVGRTAVDILSTKDLNTCISMENLELIKIVLPQRELSYYSEMLSTIYNEEYHTIDNYLSYRQYKELNVTKPNEDLLQVRWFQFVNLGRHANLRRMILLDIDEVHKCIRAKAYKAAIILCGGILESVLIDWVSEIDHVNYFEKTGYDSKLHVSLYGSNKDYFLDNDGKKSSLELVKLIDRIDGLVPPVWLHDEAEFATLIRQERNRIHSAIAIRDPVVTEEQCKKVLDYLQIVLRTRGLIA